MKNPVGRMQRVLAIAASEEKRECQEMGKSQRCLDQELQRAEELAAYRRSYAQRPAPNGPVDAARWLDYQNFLRRLDQAVELQARVVSESERHVDAHRARWLVKRQRLESLERVVERQEEASRRHHERRQQKVIDDLPCGGPHRGR
jgi:flagellar FliJ protein